MLWRFAIVGAIVAAMTIGASAQRSHRRDPPQPQTTPTQNPAATNQFGTEQSPFIVKIAPTPKTETEATQEAKERQEKAELDRRTVELTGQLAWFTGALFFATLGLVIATGGLLYMAWRQTGDMKASIAAAQKAADAAEISAAAIVAQMRAYVGVVFAKIHDFDKDGPSRVQVRIGNTGQTAAFDLTSEHGVTIRKAADSASKEDFRDGKPLPPKSKGSHGPHVITDSFIEIRKMTAEEKAAIRDGRFAIFAYGEILYKDALKSPHKTTYRLMYGGEAGANPEGSFAICEEGNDAD